MIKFFSIFSHFEKILMFTLYTSKYKLIHYRVVVQQEEEEGRPIHARNMSDMTMIGKVEIDEDAF